ncbi:patatin-like phospholipase family protein [Aneurinibacillus sp. REN35]|uniref:patatin-like phospholipase family protein n=1 Tax=Aneurinibacillus sp. REN35 TaxID=3237286 RepID=UPI003528E2F9
MERTGLVLEGGGMRGVYSGGVLDFFIEHSLYFPYVIGVSAGACHGSSYVAKQKGRNKKVTIDYINHPQYLSYRNLFREKSLFGMNLIFDELPNRLVPFDFDTFYSSSQSFMVGTTDCITGEPVYFSKDSADMLTVLRASCSLPFVSPAVTINGKELLDGGVSDPIPIRKAIADGNEKNVIILTRNKGYQKEAFKLKWLAGKVYKKYPGLVSSLIRRHIVYNETLAYIEQLEREGRVFVIRPTRPIEVDRMEKNKEKLGRLYDQGYEDAKRTADALAQWLAV